MLRPLLASLALFAAVSASAQTAPSDAIEADWRTIPDDELLVITLANEHQIVLRLAPRYAPGHVANIRKLARAHWWDGTSVYRVQDDYVAQWGDSSGEKPIPPLVLSNLPREYEWSGWDGVVMMTKPDPYSVKAGFSADGWPLASDGKATWLTHCYGMVGVARGTGESGTGAELYTVIGHAPRHLDRNITVVGRVISGIEWLSSLPRGTGDLGVYADDAQHVPILSVRLASELPEDERPHFQVRGTDNPRFAAWIKARENRQNAFFEVPSGGADLCNAMPPVRRAP